MEIFKKDGEYSWRTILTATAAFIFAFASIGYLFGLEELPKSYQSIIAGVFAFYFLKKLKNPIQLRK